MVLDRHQVDFVEVQNFGDVTTIDETFNLPGAHPISAIIVEWETEDAAANVNTSFDNVDVEIAGNSLLSRITGEQVRHLTEWHRRRTPDAPAAALTETNRLYIPMSRFAGDRQFGLPADRFNARLSIQASLDGADTTNAMRVFVEQMLDMGGQGMAVPKISAPDVVNVDGGEDWQVEGNAGRRLAALYIDADNDDLLNGERVRVGLNNRQETLFNVEHDLHSDVWMLQERDVVDDAIPAGFLAFPLDRSRRVAEAVPTGRGEAIRDFRVEGSAAAGAATGDVELLQEDYVVLAPADNN